MLYSAFTLNTKTPKTGGTKWSWRLQICRGLCHLYCVGFEVRDAVQSISPSLCNGVAPNFNLDDKLKNTLQFNQDRMNARVKKGAPFSVSFHAHKLLCFTSFFHKSSLALFYFYFNAMFEIYPAQQDSNLSANQESMNSFG